LLLSVLLLVIGCAKTEQAGPADIAGEAPASDVSDMEIGLEGIDDADLDELELDIDESEFESLDF